jgi:TetR/AcrR family transcriptional repressor of bet genes
VLDRRAQIIGAVAACVSEEGVAGVTLRKVAKRAGATTGMLTHYYQNKTALLIDASLSAERSLRNRILDRAGPLPGLDWLYAYLEESLRQDAPGTLPWTFWLEYWSYAAREAELAEHYAVMSRRQTVEIGRSIRACVSDGTFQRELDSEAAAEAFLALVNGLGVRAGLTTQAAIEPSIAAARAVLEGWARGAGSSGSS